MRYASICSGIEAATSAWHPMGWTPVIFAEIEGFPSRVLAQRYPDTPNVGDFTKVDTVDLGEVDVLVGGTPCQGFSVAGNRLSLADPRSNLALAYTELAGELSAFNNLKNAVWENVPGCLSMRDNAFGCFVGKLIGADDAILPSPKPADGKSSIGWRWDKKLGEHFPKWPSAGMASGPFARVAWRVLNAQYFGLAQRRKRVFLVVDFGNGADPAKVLFEPKSLQRNSPTRGKKRKDLAPTISARTKGGGGLGTDFDLDGGLATSTGDVSHCLNAGGMGRIDYESETLIAHALRGEGFDASEDGTGRGTPIVPVAYRTSGNCGAWETGGRTDALTTGADPNFTVVAYAIQAGALRENPYSGPDGAGVKDNIAYTVEARAEVQAVAYDLRGREGGAQFEGPHDTANIRAASGGSSRSYICEKWAVRRLTPLECERLQGFEDNFTKIPGAADGPRYKALGNSMAVPCMAWIGKRIEKGLS